MRGEWQQRKTTTIAIRTLDIVFSRLHGQEGNMCHVCVYMFMMFSSLFWTYRAREKDHGSWGGGGGQVVISGHGWEKSKEVHMWWRYILAVQQADALPSKLRRTLMNYATPYAELRRTLMNSAAPCWATPHPYELRCTLQSYTAPKLSYAAYSLATQNSAAVTPHPKWEIC